MSVGLTGSGSSKLIGTARTELIAEQIVAALKRRNVPVEYVLFPDEGHGFRKEKNRITSTVRMVEFFVTHLVDR